MGQDEDKKTAEGQPLGTGHAHRGTRQEKILTGSEEVRKLAEDFEYRPPRNLRPILPEENATQASAHQETQQEPPPQKE